MKTTSQATWRNQSPKAEREIQQLIKENAHAQFKDQEDKFKS